MKLLPKLFIVLLCLISLSVHAEKLVLVSASYGRNIIAICDEKGKPIWEYNTKGGKGGHSGHHDVHMLPNGNILFHDSWTHMVVVSLDKKVVWEYDSAKQNNKGRVDVHAFA